MSHLRSLRNELFKYSKRKNRSVDGSAPGMAYERYHRFTTPQLGSRLPGSVHQPREDYLEKTPTQYRPNMFASAVDWDEYHPDNDEFTPILKTPQVRPPFNKMLPENPMPVASSDEMSLTEQWLMNMGARPRPQEGPVPVDLEEIRHLLQGVHVPLHEIGSHPDIDSEGAIPFPVEIHTRLNASAPERQQLLPDLEHITDALNILQDRLPQDHPDMVNLQQAQKQLAWQQFEEIKQGSVFQEQYEIADNWQSNLGVGDPYINDDLIEPVIEESVPEYADSVVMQDDYAVKETQFLPHYEESVIQEFQQPVFTDDSGFQETMPQELMLEEMVEQEFMALEAQQSDMGMPMAEAAPGPEVGYADQGQPEHVMGLEVFDANPAFDEINQAMDQAAAFEQPEMDPWKQQQDAYQQMDQMMDMQMQYMANPFQMPEQMGPGYGPMPGPMMDPM